MMRGFAFARAVVVDAQPLHRADPQVLQHDVGALEQPEEERLAVGMLQVDRDALLVPIQVDEIGGFARRRTAAPTRAPCRRRPAARS